MQCQSCGTTLSPGMTTCPSCGTPVSSQTSDSPYELGDESIPYVDFGPFMETVSGSPGLQSQNRPTQSPAAQPNFSFPQPPPTYAFPPGQPPYMGAPPQSQTITVQPELQPRRGLSAGMTTLLIVLALLLVLGGGGLIYYATIFHPAELKSQATATAMAYAQATARVNAQSTAQAEAPYRKVTSGTPLINDPLTGQSGSLWETQNLSIGSCTFNSGAYHIKESQQNRFFPCFAGTNALSNFAFQVQMTILQGNGNAGGLIFRANLTNAHGLQAYFFGVDSTGHYGLNVILDSTKGQGRNLVVSTSPTIKTDLNQPNLLTVIAQGNTITLYINKQYVTRMTDTTYSSGGIGLFALAGAEPVDVAFNNAEVWTM